MRCVSRQTRDAVATYSREHHKPVRCGAATLDPVSLRWTADAPPRKSTLLASPTGVPGWFVEYDKDKDTYHVGTSGAPVIMTMSQWPIIRPSGRPGGIKATFYFHGLRTYVLDPPLYHHLQEIPNYGIIAPDAPIDYPDIPNPANARTFRGLAYGLQCDVNPSATLALVVFSMWIAELDTLLLVPVKGPSWLVMPGGVKAHLQIPASLCRSRASWAYDNVRGHLYNVGGRKSSGRRSNLIWHVNLRKYVKSCLACPDLASYTESYLRAFRAKLIEIHPEAFRAADQPIWWPVNPYVMKWRMHFLRGLCPPSDANPIWKVAHVLPRGITDPAVRFIDRGRIMIVAGGLTSRDSRTSAVEFLRVDARGLLVPLSAMQSFCPDNTSN